VKRLIAALAAMLTLSACDDWQTVQHLPDGRTVTCIKSGDTGNLDCDWAHAK
jgi:hypothetical protein